MNEAELRDLFHREPEVILAFDTNGIFGNRLNNPFLTLCDNINTLNGRWQTPRIRKVIAAPVYMEKLHDLRQAFPTYEHERILKFLEAKGIEVVPVLPHHAEHVAGMLGKRYPRTADWHAFKRQQCLSCLDLKHLAHEVKGSGEHCGATIDWLLAGHADAERYVLVTDDRVPEFERVQRKAKLDIVVKVVDEILRTSGAQPESSLAVAAQPGPDRLREPRPRRAIRVCSRRPDARYA